MTVEHDKIAAELLSFSKKEKTAADVSAEFDNMRIGNTRLQNIICLAIPIYNAFAVAQQWPVFPLPAYCSTPTNQ